LPGIRLVATRRTGPRDRRARACGGADDGDHQEEAGGSGQCFPPTQGFIQHGESGNFGDARKFQGHYAYFPRIGNRLPPCQTLSSEWRCLNRQSAIASPEFHCRRIP
jgi:hypothetical protein